MSASNDLLKAAQHIREAARLLDHLPNGLLKRVEQIAPESEHTTRELAEKLESLALQVTA